MAFIDFIKGARSKYSQETYPNSVFFASDTHELLFQGISYGWPTTMKAVKSVEINSTGLMTITYVNGGSDTIQLTKTMVGLSNVDNTADIDKPVSTAVSELVTNTKNTIDNYTVNGKKISTNPVLAKGDVGLGNVDNIKQIPAIEKGAANGVVPLNAEGKIDSVYFDGQQSPVKGVDGTYTTSTLPGSPTTGMFIYTSDDKKFREYNGSSWEVVEPKQDTLYNFRKNPPTGDSSRVSILYRWDGEDLAEVSSTVALGEVTGTAYDGGKGKANRDAIVSLPGSLVSSIARGEITGNSIVIEVNVAAKSGLNYGSPAAANLTFTAATTSVAGLMSATDKTNLGKAMNTLNTLTKITHVMDDSCWVNVSGKIALYFQCNSIGNTSITEHKVPIPVATASCSGAMSAADKEKLDGIAEGANKYVLPVATSSALGGIMIGYNENGKNYPVELSSSKAFVNVPWTDQNVTQSAAVSINGSFNLLIGNTANTNAETAGVKKAGGLTYNPSTKTLTTTTFVGSLKGNADTATKATQDANGNNIVNTYATKNSLSGYLPLSGGLLTGNLYVNGNDYAGNFGITLHRLGIKVATPLNSSSSDEYYFWSSTLDNHSLVLASSAYNEMILDKNGIQIRGKSNTDLLHAAGGTISISSLKSQLGIPGLQDDIGTNTYTGANYVSKETNLTDAILQLDEEIKAANDNLDLEHTNAEATYAKKTELNNYLPRTGGLMNGDIVGNEGRHLHVKALSSNWNNNLNNYITGIGFYDPTDSILIGEFGYYNYGQSSSPEDNSWIGISANVRNVHGDSWRDAPGDCLFKITAKNGVYYDTHKLVDETQLTSYLTRTDASNTYQPKGNYLTSVNLASISDLHANWDSVLKSAPTSYVTRWPSISEVTGKQNLTIYKGDSTVNNYNGTSKFILKVPGYYNFSFTMNEDYFKLFTIRLTRNYINHLICFDITGRSGGVDHVYLSFNNESVISAYRVITFGYIGVGVYGPKLSIRKVSGTSTEAVFEIYLAATQGYDECTVFNFIGNYTGFNIEIGGPVTSLPSGTTACVGLNVFRGIAKASTTAIGGIKVGNGLEIESDGTLNCTVQPGSGTVSWGNISGKPSFATVATSGSYNDLTNKPSIPSLSGYATQSWVNSQGFLRSGDVKDIQALEVRSASDNSLQYVELRIEGYDTIQFRRDTKSITWGDETVFTVPSLSGYVTTGSLENSLYPSLTFSRSSGISGSPFLSSKLSRRQCVNLNTILGNTGYRIIAEPETTSGLYLLSFSLYSGLQPTSACEIYSCLFTNITGEDLYRLEKAYPGIMNAMGTGNGFTLNGTRCKALGKGYFMLDN